MASQLTSAKANITYIEANLYAKTHRIHLKIIHKECALILITSDKKRAKATSHMRRIQDGQPAKVCCSALKGGALRQLL